MSIVSLAGELYLALGPGTIKLSAIDVDDDAPGDGEADESDRTEREQESGEGNLRSLADNDILWIARNRRRRADVGRHGQAHQVGHRIALEPAGQAEHQRGEGDDDGIV